MFDGLTRKGRHPGEAPTPPPPPAYTLAREDGLLIERNLAVSLRDGVRIFVDVYRPDGKAGESNLGVIIG